MTDHAIIVFARNPVLGKVKTRLAESMGEEAALKIYKSLINLTQTAVITHHTIVYYSDFIEENDGWQGLKRLQNDHIDLGQKMKAAFANLWNAGYKKLILIGTDCPDMRKEILDEAIENLENHAAILGPALDGGYYAVGFNVHSVSKKILDRLFVDKKWSHAEVANEAIEVMKKEKITYWLLPTLEDVDVAEDWENYLLKQGIVES